MLCCCPLWLMVTVGVMIAIKLYIKLTTAVCKDKVRLDGKTAIVTGSNTGIGLESALDLARRGARIVMVCRDIEKAERAKKRIVAETGNANVIIKHIDFQSLHSVRKCANEILHEESRIDILLNNAGAGGIGFKQTSDELDEMMQCNHFGPFLFTNILLGRIKESAPARIVNVSSAAYRLANLDLNYVKKASKPVGYIGLYSISKLANVLFSNELASKLKGSGVTVNSLHPGVIETEITRNNHIVFRMFFKTMSVLFFKSVREGAQTSIYLCVSPEVEGVTGKFFEECKMVPLVNGADDMGVAKKLWDISEDAVKLQADEIHY